MATRPRLRCQNARGSPTLSVRRSAGTVPFPWSLSFLICKQDGERGRGCDSIFIFNCPVAWDAGLGAASHSMVPVWAGPKWALGMQELVQIRMGRLPLGERTSFIIVGEVLGVENWLRRCMFRKRGRSSRVHCRGRHALPRPRRQALDKSRHPGVAQPVQQAPPATC